MTKSDNHMNAERTLHSIPPVFDQNSQILILGSFPSVKSREVQFFYGHPQNRFWRILSSVFEKDIPVSIDEKRQFLLANHIAVWDVVSSCRISGSSDSTIRDVSPNDISLILEKSSIQKIFTNGHTATKLYRQHLLKSIGIDVTPLPSSSPANASFSLEKLIAAWKIVKCK